MTPKPTPSLLKIGFVFDDSLDKPDGVQQYILSIGSWLSAQGHEVHYLVGKTTRHDIAGVHSLSRNASVRFNGNGMSIPLPTSRVKLRQFLDEENFDVLHVQVPYSPWLGGRLIEAASAQTAIVGTFHIVVSSWLGIAATRALGLYTARTVARFDDIVSVSAAAQTFAQRTYDIRTDVVPNAIDYPRFKKARRLPQYTDDIPTILFLGRLVPRKGCHLLLEAVSMLKKAQPTAKFRVVVCGKGPELGNLKAFVARQQLESVVEFVGFVAEAEKPSYYASADISVFPSSGGESFGIVLVEAMASGKACVLGGDNSGYRSVLDAQPELLFAPRDAAGLAAKLHFYLNNDKQRRAKAKWGQTYAAQFDRALVGEQLLERYKQALHKRRSTAIIGS